MKDENKNLQLEIIRHSASHVMAAAVKQLYGDKVKFAIGPSIEDGFYYDFDLGDKTISEDDFKEIEKKMKHIIKQNLKFIKEEVDIKTALAKMTDQPYKLELINDLAKDGNKTVSFYKLGDIFEDLCSGPHVESSIKIGPFKLLKVAGAYWRGDEKNKMLQRIYGSAFENQEELDNYLKMIEEAEKRDHRKIGKEQKLFMISEEVGQGLVMFLPKGAYIRRQLENYMFDKEKKHGYSFVMTPVLASGKMYEKSGHLEHYREDMYNPIDIEGEDYYLKPMNCPHHHIMYKNLIQSYRDLPIRIADFGMIHRFERSGVLTGLIRARNFSQNDAHIYCAKKLVKDEFLKVLQLFDEVYKDFGIKNYWFRLSLPDYNNTEKYGDIENKEMWEYSANVARQAMKEHGAKFVEEEGEAAFYGPKIDVQVKNVLGKEDTIATIQVDFYMPQKFNLKFKNEKGEDETPVIIHRAIMGSFERFMAFFIEQTSGNFPIWIAPVQVKLLPVSDKFNKYANEIKDQFETHNIRVELDDSAETLGKKIRNGEQEKIPYLLVIGEKEVNDNKVAVRKRSKGDLGQQNVDEFIAQVKKEIEDKVIE